jgi:hypothetical protein
LDTNPKLESNRIPILANNTKQSILQQIIVIKEAKENTRKGYNIRTLLLNKPRKTREKATT